MPSGIKVEGEEEGNAREHGDTKRRIRRKVHIGTDEKTLEIRAAEFTADDAPVLPELLDQIPAGQEIASGELANAEGAFDTRECHDAIAARGAASFGPSLEPVAFVPSLPPRRNAKPWSLDTAGAIKRNEAPRASQRFGRTIWRRW